MAMTGAITVDSATATAGAKNSLFTVTVSNSVAFDIPVLSVDPRVYLSGTADMENTVTVGEINLNSNTNVVPGSSSKTFQFEVGWHAPIAAGSAGQNALPATVAYDVTAVVLCADGTTIIPTAVTVTVSPHAHN